MSSINALKQEVKELKAQVNPTKIIITIGLTVEQQRKHYAELMANPANDFMKAPDHPFHSLESFLECHKNDKIEVIEL
jgi:hypothetical protein